jgi:bifunctional ADP-heptose synthase (sugar kinase/adenylyltransferase)
MIVVPNDYEAAMAAGVYESHTSHAIADSVVLSAGEKLRQMTGRPVFITRGERGISLFGDAGRHSLVSTVALDGEIDATGAGDTVASAIAAALCAGASLQEAAELANLAGRITVGKIGTTGVASPEEIMACHALLRGDR